jgi:hypothetical protein
VSPGIKTRTTSDHGLITGYATLYRVFLSYYATSRTVAGLITDEVSKFFIHLILSVALWPWVRLSL